MKSWQKPADTSQITEPCNSISSKDKTWMLTSIFGELFTTVVGMTK